MEDVVAVAVTLDTGAKRYFITWGRIQDRVDGEHVAALVLRFSRKCDLGGEPVAARLCHMLRDAADQPYFYEALLSFAHRPIPFGPKYSAWKRKMAERMAEGKEISYLGNPDTAAQYLPYLSVSHNRIKGE